MMRNTLENIWRFVKKGSPDECWPWTGGLGQNGYGKTRVYTRSTRLAHVLIFESATGVRPVKDVMHSCNNKLCCNPKHLIEGDDSTNQIHYVLTDQPTRSNSGVKGITFSETTGYYRARAGQVCLYVGPDFNEARRARESWEAQQRERLSKIHDTSKIQESYK